MTIYTHEFKKEAEAYALQMVEESTRFDYEEIQNWIKENKREAIVEFMRDDNSWKHIVLAKISVIDIEILDELGCTNDENTGRKYVEIVDNILFHYFYDTLADVNQAIIDYLENLPTQTRQDEEDEWNRDFEAMR